MDSGNGHYRIATNCEFKFLTNNSLQEQNYLQLPTSLSHPLSQSPTFASSMSLPAPPLPPSGRFLEYVRRSSQALTQAEAVTVSPCIGTLFPNFYCCCVSRCHSIGVSFLCAWCAPPLCNYNFIRITPRLIWHGRQRKG